MTRAKQLSKYRTLVLIGLTASNLIAQEWDTSRIQKETVENLASITADFLNYLSIPNVSSDLAGIEQNGNYLQNYLNEIGLDNRIVKFQEVPYLLADWNVGEQQTILFYLQLDGQPVDPKLWDQTDPFDPVVKLKQENQFISTSKSTLFDHPDDAYIFARSASDSKGPAFAFLSALGLLKKTGFIPAYNIKIIGDFQEEKGSPTIAAFVNENRELLQAQSMLVMDGTRHISNKPTLMFGARGIAYFSMTVHGPKNNLHSGQYGNVIQNPAFVMAHLLSSMKDQQGRVTIDGFYDGVVFSQEEEAYFDALNESWSALGLRVGSIHFDKIAKTIQQAFHYPSLNIRGLQAGWTGDAVRTILPDKVLAEFDLRLTPESDGAQQRDRIVAHLQKQGFFVTDAPPTSEIRNAHPKIVELHFDTGKAPYRTSIDHPIGQWTAAAMTRGLGHNDLVKISTTGGSQPIAAFIKALEIPAVALRIPNPDNNIHAPNENIRFKNFIEGIQMILGILTSDVMELK